MRELGHGIESGRYGWGTKVYSREEEEGLMGRDGAGNWKYRSALVCIIGGCEC